MPISPVDPQQQAAISGAFAQPPRGGSFGEILDQLLALREQEQKRVSEAFEAITRGNPALAAIIAAQPGFTANLVAAPSLRGPSRAKVAAAQIEAGVQKSLAPAEADVLALKPEQISQVAQDALADLTPEALANPAAVRNYITFRTTVHDGVRAEAVKLLAEGGALRNKDLPNLAKEVDFVMGLVAAYPEQSARLAIQTPVDALNFLRHEDLRDALLNFQVSLAKLQLSKGEAPDPNIIRGILNDRDRKRDQLAEVKAQLSSARSAKAAAAKDPQAAAASELARSLGLGTADEEALAAQVASLEASLAELDELLGAAKKSGKPAKPASGAAETPEQRKARFKKEHPELFPGQ